MNEMPNVEAKRTLSELLKRCTLPGVHPQHFTKTVDGKFFVCEGKKS